MKVLAVVGLLIVVLVIWFLWRRLRKEKVAETFRRHLPSVMVEWSPIYPITEASYDWNACVVGGCPVSSSPSAGWPTSPQKAPEPRIRLSSDNCPACNFKDKIYFAVRTNSRKRGTSDWFINTIDLGGSVHPTSTAITESDGSSPLAIGSANFGYIVKFGSPLPVGLVCSFVLTVARGSETYHYRIKAALSEDREMVDVRDSFLAAVVGDWTGHPPGVLKSEDLVSVAILLEKDGADKPYYYGTTSMLIAKPGVPPSPYSLSYRYMQH